MRFVSGAELNWSALANTAICLKVDRAEAPFQSARAAFELEEVASSARAQSLGVRRRPAGSAPNRYSRFKGKDPNGTYYLIAHAGTRCPATSSLSWGDWIDGGFAERGFRLLRLQWHAQMAAILRAPSCGRGGESRRGATSHQKPEG